PSLPFAVGVYLPVATMVPVFLGGLLRGGLERRAASEEERLARRDRGVLFGSGLVGGEGLLGVVIAGAAGWAVARGQAPWSIGTAWAGGGAGLDCRLLPLRYLHDRRATAPQPLPRYVECLGAMLCDDRSTGGDRLRTVRDGVSIHHEGASFAMKRIILAHRCLPLDNSECFVASRSAETTRMLFAQNTPFRLPTRG